MRKNERIKCKGFSNLKNEDSFIREKRPNGHDSQGLHYPKVDTNVKNWYTYFRYCLCFFLFFFLEMSPKEMPFDKGVSFCTEYHKYSMTVG